MKETTQNLLGKELQDVDAKRFAIVVARWYPALIARLLKAAKTTLMEGGCHEDLVDVFWVPGSFELSQAVSALAKKGDHAAIIPLGIIVRGETSHYDHIADTTVRSLDLIGRDTGVTVSLGLVTVENMDQAIARCGGKKGNKGEEAARAALELLTLLEKLKGSK